MKLPLHLALPLLLTLVLTAAVSPVATDLPSFAFENYDGRAITNASFEGKTTIVVPTYAKCVFACPMVTFLLTELDREIGRPADVQYLHVSIQPAEDTAEEILSHFDDHEIDRADRRWLFVNGSAPEVEKFFVDTGIEITRTPVEGGDMIEHTIRVWVVGPDGRIRAEFDTYFWDDKEMRDALRASLSDPGT